jgi:acetyl esterase/lipase
MQIILTIVQTTMGIVSLLLAAMSIFLFIPFRWPAPAIWGLKIAASVLSSLFILFGLLTLVVGFITNSLFIIIIGSLVTAVYLFHHISVTRPPSAAFRNKLDIDNGQLLIGRKKYFLSRRTVLRLPAVPQARLKQDIPYATIPGTDRKLLCDLWQPHESVKPSGIALIFMHGSAFYFLDKDLGTRPFFKHLAAQGHVIMDVAYRLAPETDLMGMIHDVKRAIAWMKENATGVGVDPDRIILGGGSAGGYLALMTGYTINDPLFIPVDLAGKDLAVSAVIALYPATDLEALYYHTNQHITTRPQPGKLKKKVPAGIPAWMKKVIGKDLHRLGLDKDLDKVGLTAPLMGGRPDECPEKYKFFSIITHVDANCPPTLLIQGEHDIMAPVKSTRLLYAMLVKENVPSCLHTLPQTDHAFDLFNTVIAPAAHNAIFDVERFIALFADTATNRNLLRPYREKALV